MDRFQLKVAKLIIATIPNRKNKLHKEKNGKKKTKRKKNSRLARKLSRKINKTMTV